MEDLISDGSSKTFKVWYKNDPSFRVDAEEKNVAIEDFTFMGRFKVVELDDLFELLNTDNNPLGSFERQTFIRSNFLHTSMSVGDMAIDESTGLAYLCASFGWQQVTVKPLVPLSDQ